MTNLLLARNDDANVLMNIHSVDHEICSIFLSVGHGGSLARKRRHNCFHLASSNPKESHRSWHWSSSQGRHNFCSHLSSKVQIRITPHGSRHWSSTHRPRTSLIQMGSHATTSLGNGTGPDPASTTDTFSTEPCQLLIPNSTSMHAERGPRVWEVTPPDSQLNRECIVLWLRTAEA